MKTKIGLIDYGLSGNIQSVKKALNHEGAEVKIISGRKDLNGVEKIVLPGVGSFKDTMNKLSETGLKEELIKHIQKKPILGICLGMQILSKVGFEYGETEGLKLVDAEVKRIEVSGKVPHIGWARIEIVRNNPLFKGINDEEVFYFMHSYEVINYTDVSALTTYCGHRFVSAIHKDNIYGVQFHPEKSRLAGLKVLENFIKL
jgi:imidazole glycerol-phosphate synthase subunit HisH